ncbi:Sugar-tranasporters, 12 TM, putative [Angomonas deanei]|uniref:Molybdate-anion transporter n=1 Tax=Angomonas deanei TaxID=59799 RepID=A0A7G2CEL7_9TRYP|nr:Sugar-tranasporters, 12 TM, putative [Angomonas deanei]
MAVPPGEVDLVPGEGVPLSNSLICLAVSIVIVVLELHYIKYKDAVDRYIRESVFTPNSKEAFEEEDSVAVFVSPPTVTDIPVTVLPKEEAKTSFPVVKIKPCVEQLTEEELGRRSSEFEGIQREFVLVYALCYFCDFLKGPYNVILYQYHGLSLKQIAFVLTSGNFASLMVGTFAAAASDRLGRRFMCRVYCVLYSISMLSKVSSNYHILIAGRIVGSVGLSLLFTSFESWLVSVHGSLGLPSYMLQNAFADAFFCQSVSAVVAGVVAQSVAYVCGVVAPFLVAVPIALFAFYRLGRWSENYGDVKANPFLSLKRGFAVIYTSKGLQLLALCETTFEACIGLWVFLWTPTVDSTGRQSSFGVMFSVYMISTMIGGLLCRLVSVPTLLVTVHFLFLISVVGAVLLYRYKTVVFVCYCLIEMSVGIFFSTHPTVRSGLVEDATRSSVLSWFRVPINLLVFTLLNLNLTPRQLLYVLVILQSVSGLGMLLFRRWANSSK